MSERRRDRSRSAVGAAEAPVEHMRPGLAAVLALEQSPVAAFIAPCLLRLLGVAVEEYALILDPVDHRAGHRMMGAAGVLVRLGQDDAIAGDPVHRADMLLVAADDFHMLADLAEHLALGLALRPPIAK